MDKIELHLEPTLDIESAPSMELACTLVEGMTDPNRYWQAQAWAELLLHEFSQARVQGDRPAMRARFYQLAGYYTRTASILRYALNQHKATLAERALHNLIALHKPLQEMHRTSPKAVPVVLTLNREMRAHVLDDLIIQVLQEAPGSLDPPSLAQRVGEANPLAEINEAAIERRLQALIAGGYVQLSDQGYARTRRRYAALNVDQSTFQTLVGAELAAGFARAGFRGLADIAARRDAFRGIFCALTHTGDAAAALFSAAVETISGARVEETAPTDAWRYADLIGSAYPRPYQYEAYAIFRGYGYQGQIIEAPTGSGKTMIGMMCIQDWLRSLSPGQSILILVPTVNYQQQWVGELCYKPIGLGLSPDAIFAGAPAALDVARKRSALSPAVIVMTYAALAQSASAVGKGGFDHDAIETFLQGNNVQYVVLDEVHKVAEDLQSASADVTRTILEWLRDGSLKGVIGFSGTAEAFRAHFATLGLQLVYVLPAAELIAYGFVAPFAELGVPFAYSAREQRIRELLDEYKTLLREWLKLIGGEKWRKWFAAIPLDERLSIARDLLRLYAERPDQDDALRKRLREWEQGGEIALTELALVSIVQLAKGWPDEEVWARSRRVSAVRGAGAADAATTNFFDQLLDRLSALRANLGELIYLADARRRLAAEGFGRALDAPAAKRLSTEVSSSAARAERARDILATTIAGLYEGISDWYLRVGEGRVDNIKAIIEAERAVRSVSGVIVFDLGKRMRWQSGVAAPGYGGVPGVFAQMLGDSRFTPLAATSTEIYMPWNEADPLPPRIARFVRREIMQGELGEALFGLSTTGLTLSKTHCDRLREQFDKLLSSYIETAADIRLARQGEFRRRVLNPLRRAARAILSGKGVELRTARERLLARLHPKNDHLSRMLATLFDYAHIAAAFEHAHLADLIQVSGAQKRFAVVHMGQGARKQLMYDLTSRIVDDESLGVNLIIVSPWARTGWNVIKPNLLIDATATREVTAWQQLRGRAMRARRAWDNDCYRAVLLLGGARAWELDEDTKLPADALAAYEEVRQRTQAAETLPDELKKLLQAAHGTKDALADKLAQGELAAFTAAERGQLIAELMLARNKVTHIYELVKAYGSTNQIRYDRAARAWQRSAPIAAKHADEYSVNLLSGRYGSGSAHAPLVYAGDPRQDTPAALEQRLSTLLQESDQRIVHGWLRAIAPEPVESRA